MRSCKLGISGICIDDKKSSCSEQYYLQLLISAFCWVGHVAEALKLEQTMRQSGLVPGVFTSNILIDGFCREGRLELDMVNNRFFDIQYNTIINASQDMNGAMIFMNKMLADGCDPDVLGLFWLLVGRFFL
jgi:hypothetical protein